MMKKTNPGTMVSSWWYDMDQRVKIALMGLVVLILLALCIAAALVASRLLQPGAEAEPTPTIASTPTTAPAPPTTAPTAPAPTLAPTATPAPTETPPPAEPSPAPPADDPQGDVGTYAAGGPVEEAPSDIDIRTASIGANLQVVLQPSGVPAELAAWVTEDEALLWITLYEPIPDAPEGNREWLFTLDLDGDVETGRPAGSARINPDLGVEVAVGLSYNPANGQFSTYSLIWDTEQGRWVAGPEARFQMDEARTSVGLALPLEALIQAVEETAGVTIAPEAVTGRAAALAGVGEQRVIDFYPDLPD